MGLFDNVDKLKLNAKPIFKQEVEQVEQATQQDIMHSYRTQLESNIFKPSSDLPQQDAEETPINTKLSVFGKGTEVQALEKLEPLQTDDVINNMRYCVDEDFTALSAVEDASGKDILLRIKLYISPLATVEAKNELIKEIRDNLDNVFVSKTTEVSENSRSRLAKYFKHFNEISLGSLDVPEEYTAEHPCLFKDASQTEPDEKQHKFTTRKKDMRDQFLFDHVPHISDVRQGSVGDCYFLAATASLLAKDPQIISSMMKDNGDGTVTVRFYEHMSQREVDDKNYWDGLSYSEMTATQKLAYGIHCNSLDSIAHHDPKLTMAPIFHHIVLCMSHGHEFELGLAEKLIALSDLEDSDLELKDGETAKERFLELLSIISNKIPKDIQEAILDDEKAVADEWESRFADGEYNAWCYTNKPVPLYVTVSKETTVKESDGSDVYAKDSLWVQMLEKAYAASGLADRDELAGYKALDEGGHSYTALTHMTGKEKETLFSHGNNSTASTSKMALHGALRSVLVASDDDSLIQKLRESIPSLAEAPPETLNKLVDILKKSDESNIRQIRRANTSYRFRAADLDEIAPLILDSKLQMLSGESAKDKTANATLRQQLAVELTDLMSTSEKSKLSFKPFSGKYSKAATSTYDNIKKSIEAGKHVTAGTISFVPESVTQIRGLNRESMKQGIAEKHAYSIINTKQALGIRYIVLRNPWGKTTRQYIKADSGEIYAVENSSADTSGVFQLELNDFLANFSHVEAN